MTGESKPDCGRLAVLGKLDSQPDKAKNAGGGDASLAQR